MASISNIFIDQGADYTSTVTVTDSSDSAVNLTGFSAAQIRKSHLSSTSTDFATSITDATAGQITITLTDTQTTVSESGRYVYDVVITSGSGVKTRVVEEPSHSQSKRNEVIKWQYLEKYQVFLKYKVLYHKEIN